MKLRKSWSKTPKTALNSPSSLSSSLKNKVKPRKKSFEQFKKILSPSSKKKPFYNNSTFTKLDDNEVKYSNNKLIIKEGREDVEDGEDVLNMSNMIKSQCVMQTAMFEENDEKMDNSCHDDDVTVNNYETNQNIITNTVISPPDQNIIINKDISSPDILIEPSETMDINDPSSSMEDFEVFDSNTIATNHNDVQSHASEPSFRVR